MLIDSRRGSTMRSSVLAMWKEVGIDPEWALGEIAKERELMQRLVHESGEAAGVSGPVRAFVIPQLRSVGLFSERIESHFRDMFAANFGLERAQMLDLGLPLPEDLDAWALS